MSYRTFFMFLTGIERDLLAPTGTFDSWREHVVHVEQTLELKAERYADNPAHWRKTRYVGVDDEVLCQTVSSHNQWVRRVYQQIFHESPVKGGEVVTPDQMATIWHGLEILSVPTERWTSGFYRERAEHLYEVMRGRDNEGVSLDAEPLTEQQAAAVTRLFSEFIESGDLRLDVPVDRDHLASSDDGGYTWCMYCGPIDEDDSCFHLVVEGSREEYCHECDTCWTGILDDEDPWCEHLEVLAVAATPSGCIWCTECKQYWSESERCKHQVEIDNPAT